MSAAIGLSESKRALLERILSGGDARGGGDTPPIPPRPSGLHPPLSPEQNDIWLHASMAPGALLYNESVTIRRYGPCDLAALERSLDEIVRRHEIWRTSFREVEGRLRQIVHPELRLSLELVDLAGLPVERRVSEAERRASESARLPFDLARLPLLRPLVLRLAPDEHWLHLSLHHIIFDGVSFARTILPEMARLYEAFASGRAPELPPPRLQYGDYAVWRERELAREANERALEYWRSRFADGIPPLELPADRPRPAVLTYSGALEKFGIAPKLTAALKKLALQEGATLYMLLLATLKALLHRYSGQEDLVVGGIRDGRDRPELERVVGFFLHTMPLRTRPSPATPFRDYLREVKNTVLGAIEASQVPFERVVRELQPKRDPGRHPLFQILFTMEAPAASPEGWEMTQGDAAVGAAKFDIYIEMDERPEGLIGRLFYSTDLFEPSTVRRMIANWSRLMEEVAKAPQATLGSFPLLSAEETRQLAVAWNRTERAIPYPTLPAWFAAQAAATPERAAIEAGGERLTYRQLAERVDGLAARLCAEGIGPGALVAVAVERSLDLPVALLAVLRVGGAYLPLDPSLPQPRIATLLDEAKPVLLLTQRALRHRFAMFRLPALACDEPAEERGPHRISGSAAGDGLAYLLYTSGSTGKPKGVEIRHDALANALSAFQDELGVGAEDRLLALATISFDIAMLELFLPLVSGGCTIIAAREDAADPHRLAGLIERSACTIVQATPTSWRMLREAGWRGSRHLRAILCGAEALTEELATQLLACRADLWNVYGPTETTIWSLAQRVTQVAGPVPIGRPIANTRAYVLDARGALAPIGVPGELYIAGAGLARGYRGDPELTAAKFVALPSLGERRAYRTGDRARYRSDGAIEYLGRTDNQVKIRGFRVGLEEVEAAILAHPEVAAAAARTFPDPAGGARLVAYVVWRGERRPEAELLTFLRQSLPGYMVPARVVALDSLPMTPSRKVDRKRLPEPEPAAPPALAAPRDELERTLAEIWAETLGLPAVDVHANFFDLGGHSLLAFRAVAAIKSATGAELRLASFLAAPSVASLAELLRTGGEGPFSYLVPLRAEGAGRPLFIVHGLYGNVVQLRGLAAHIHVDRPIYAIQARGVDPRQEPHGSLGEMATAYLAAIRRVQPRGPYALAGYSFGGLVAYEMACRLRHEGEAVEALALVDTNVHDRNLPLGEWLAFHAGLLRRATGKLRRLPLSRQPAYLAAKARQLADRLAHRFGLREYRDPPPEWRESLPPRYMQIYRLGMRAFTAYRPASYPGKLAFFRSAEPHPDACNPLPVWTRRARAVAVYDIPGQHTTVMYEPYVQVLAQQLSRYLAEAAAEAEHG
jgi:amino acid adenylation domain-containing protein